MSRAFDKVGQSSERLHSRVGAVGLAIGGLAAGGVVAMGGMAAGAIKTGIQTAAAMQQAQLGFATLLGSEKAAGDYMKWLTGFAAATPFELQGLVQSSRTLIGVGVSAKDAKVMLQNFGDTASAIGIDQDAFQRVMLATSQAISAGKFQAGDLNLSTALGTDLQGVHHPGRQGAERPHQGRHRPAAGRGVVHGGAASDADRRDGQVRRHDGRAEAHPEGAEHRVRRRREGRRRRVQWRHRPAEGRLRDAFRDLAIKYLPDLTRLANWMAAQAPGAIAKADDAFGNIQTAVKAAADVIVPMFNFIREHSTIFGSVAVGIGTVVAAIKMWQTVTKAFTSFRPPSTWSCR
jgi:hypothetical protein